MPSTFFASIDDDFVSQSHYMLLLSTFTFNGCEIISHVIQNRKIDLLPPGNPFRIFVIRPKRKHSRSRLVGFFSETLPMVKSIVSGGDAIDIEIYLFSYCC